MFSRSRCGGYIIGRTAPLALGRGRVAYLDGIRAIAIFSVLSYHLGRPYVPALHSGYIGVDVFFVLSGYIITQVLWSNRTGQSVAGRYRQFMWQRVRRLYPALLGLLVVGVIVIGIAGIPTNFVGALQNAAIAGTQTMNFYMGSGYEGPSPFAHTWSLANEWLFYLIWPLGLFLALKRGLRPKTLAWIAVGTAVIAYALALPMTSEWFYFGPVSRAAQLLAGCALALFLVEHADTRKRTASWVGTALVVTSVAALIAWVLLGSELLDFEYRYTGFLLATAAGIALILAGAIAQPGLGTAVLSLAPVTYLGRISYSVYLWHLLPILVLSKDVLALPTVVLAAIGLISLVALSLGSYYLLEKPFMHARPAKVEAGSK